MTLRILALARSLLCLPGKIASWLILPLVLTILLSVIAAIMGWSTLIDWEGELPILGSALTVNSLLDLQWYSFALIVLFGGVWAFFEDRHVTVDFLALHFSPRARALISLFGDLFLLLPLCALCIWYGSRFAGIAWRTGEGSTQGGLEAHWLIKGAVPVSFALLGLAGIVRMITTLRELRQNTFHEIETHHDS
ncbi:TRAP transporter small permease subunit [Salipiger sp. P9]|nr:TRAP transporter small permease subunit [Salipiger pentaromativorans]